MYGFGKDCLILIPFRLPQIGCFTLSFECFSSDSDNCPDVGIDRTTASVPPPTKGRPHPTKTLVFPPSSFILPSFAWFYILFSTSQVLLFALSWYSACTSVSEGVFLMYPWREAYSTSTYSSTIVFSSLLFVFTCLFHISHSWYAGICDYYWHQSHSPHSCHYWKKLHFLTLIPLWKSQSDLLGQKIRCLPLCQQYCQWGLNHIKNTWLLGVLNYEFKIVAGT